MAPKFGGNLLDFSIQHSPLSLNFAPVNPSSSSAFKFKAASHNFYGSYALDLAEGIYSLSWDSLDMMKAWLRKEEETKFVELRLKETRQNKSNNGEWTQKLLYVCARQGTGGNKKYQKKHPKWDRKIPGKRCGCASRLTIKCYPNTECVLGLYEHDHSHPTGQDNARFTRLPEETRLQMAEMLRMGITHKRIVSYLIVSHLR